MCLFVLLSLSTSHSGLRAFFVFLRNPQACIFRMQRHVQQSILLYTAQQFLFPCTTVARLSLVGCCVAFVLRQSGGLVRVPTTVAPVILSHPLRSSAAAAAAAAAVFCGWCLRCRSTLHRVPWYHNSSTAYSVTFCAPLEPLLGVTRPAPASSLCCGWFGVLLLRLRLLLHTLRRWRLPRLPGSDGEQRYVGKQDAVQPGQVAQAEKAKVSEKIRLGWVES